MKKYVIIAVLFIAFAFFANASNPGSNVQMFPVNRQYTSTANVSQDNVAAMAMDANFTYVVQNVMPNPSTLPPYSSISLSGALAIQASVAYEFGSVIVDRIDNATGAITNLARIDITTLGSYIVGTGVTLYNNRLYIVGYYAGDVKPNGALPTQTSSSEDMFICTVSTTSTGVLAWNQSTGNGDERATCITNNLGTICVGGYYTALGAVPVSSTWNTPGGTTTAPGIAATGQCNTFIGNFSNSTLACTKVNGWMTLSGSSSSAQINGIVVATAAGTSVNYVTGSITGSATNPSLTGVSTGATMFTARFVNTNIVSPPAPNTWSWAVLDGTCYTTSGGAPPLANAGKALIFGSATELYVAGAAAYISGTGPTGYHNGTSDAVVVKYTGITGVAPTRAYTIAIGTGINDVANAIVHDGSSICVTGTMSSGNYSFSSIGQPTLSYASSSQTKVFVARYSTAGVLDWDKTGDALSNNGANSTAIACAGGCNLAFGGATDRNLTWDVYQNNGAPTPSTWRLFANFLPVQKVAYTVPFVDPYVLNNTSSTTRTATGASTYAWSFSNAAYPAVNVSLSAPSSATNMTTIVSGGSPGTYIDLSTVGTYTRGGTCTAETKTRINQTTLKTDEQATGIDDPDKSVNTLNIFPNPFANHVQLDYSFATPGQGLMQIVDLQGRVIAEKVLDSQSASEIIATTEWASGTYIVNLLQAGNTVFSKQIVK